MARATYFARPRAFRFSLLGTILVLVFLIPVMVGDAFAQGEEAPPIVLTDTHSQYSLSSKLEILRDPTRKLTIQEVSSPAYAAHFMPNQQKVPNLGLTADAVWVRFRARDDAPAGASWLLALDEQRQGLVELYLPAADGGYLVKRTGRDLPFSSRDFPNRAFVFRLDLPQGMEAPVYLRLESSAPMIIPLSIWAADAFAQHAQTDLLVYGLFYGAMFIMAGYNLFLAVSLRDASYLYLALFILSFSFNQAARDGLGQQYLYPGFSNRHVNELSTTVMMVLLILFSTRILETRLRLPRLHRVLLAIIVLFSALLLLEFFRPINAMGLVLIQATFILLGIAGFLVLRQGYRPAGLYLLSWFLFFLTAFVFATNGLRPLPNFSVPDEPLMLAISLGALLGSLALADRVSLLRAETEAASLELAKSEAKYRSLFDNSRDGIFITTREGEYVDANPAWLRLFGMTLPDLAHTNAADLYLDPSERAGFLQAMDEHGFVEDFPVQLRSKNGAPIFALVSATGWKDSDSGQHGIQGTVHDVTEQRRVEQELAEQQVRMEEAVTQERGRLARELHDSVTQSLYSIGLYANAAARALKLDKQAVGAEHVGQIIQLTLEAMVDMRSLIFELRPPLLSKVGLPTALETRLKAVEGRTGIAIEFHSDGKDGLSLSTQAELYRIAQEALSNIAKHSRAEHVVVDLSFGADGAALEIRDDGDGFDVESARQKNTMGLRSIAERAQKIDAVVSVTSTPGQGTVVRVEVPNA